MEALKNIIAVSFDSKSEREGMKSERGMEGRLHINGFLHKCAVSIHNVR